MPMEKFPNISFVGRVSAESVEKKALEYEQQVTEDHRLNLTPEIEAKLNQYEVPKSPKNVQLFEHADTWAQERQKICGVQTYDFPPRNIFLLTEEGYREMVRGRGSGAAYVESQRVVAIDRANTFRLTAFVFHEIMHCKGKIVIELSQHEGDIHENVLRSGLVVGSTNKKNREGEKHTHLIGLEEAVVAQEEVYFSFDLLRRPEFRELKERMDSESGQQTKREILTRTGLVEDDLSWFDSESGEYEMVGYPGQRKVLRYLCREIADEQGSTDNEVYFEFLKGHFSGRLPTIAKLVEGTFGEGAFRRLGDMGKDDNSAVQTLEALKKKRLSFLKAKEKK
ncbi:MAG: hypothetical protein IPJ68_03090 [Candidatus Moraniibacteriota bacterium]|nr:MAG: hypothetical protein IPJ68_03090 [Candidatus Moranbacteria bacterium]